MNKQQPDTPETDTPQPGPSVAGQFSIDPVQVYNVLVQRAQADKELALHLEAARWQVASLAEQSRRIELETQLLDKETE